MNPDTPLTLLHQMVPMEGLLEIADGVIKDVGDLVEAGAGVAVVLVVVIVAIISRLSIPKILMAGLAAGIVYWLVVSGVQSIGDGTEAEFKERENASAPIVQTYTPPTHETVR